MNVYLIGYRGTGKSSLGRFIALELERDFVDTDELIVEREGISIPVIFQDLGEDYFRKVETEILEEISAHGNLIVSTGGGIILSEKNRKIMKDTGYCVYLTAPVDVIHSRISGDPNRPKLTDKPAYEEIEFMLKKRKPFYEEAADLTVDTGEMNFKTAAETILTNVKKEVGA